MASPSPRPRAPPALPDELVEEVLLRVPPEDPATLARAALACRRWRGLVADPAFHCRRLELHGAVPPMLGFVYDGFTTTSYIPTSSCRPPRAEHRGRRAFDARHGRVLLHGREYEDFIVWNPITDQLVELPIHGLVGFVEGVCVAFVAVQNMLFTVDMKSGLMRKVFEGCSISCVAPYITFCPPALEASSRDDGPRVGTSSASNNAS